MLLTPANFEIGEGAPFSLTVTVVDDATPPDPPPPPDPLPPDYVPPDMSNPAVIITSVTSDYPQPSVLLSHTNDTFTVSGAFLDVFPKTISYLNTSNDSVTVTKFADLPEHFNTLYSYRAPLVMIKSVFITVTFLYHPAITYEIDVRYDWQTANAAFRNEVKIGYF